MEESAIKNAKKLDEGYKTLGNKSYEKMNPFSTVYKLIQRIRELKIAD
jgi:hypothetical protein